MNKNMFGFCLGFIAIVLVWIIITISHIFSILKDEEESEDDNANRN